MYLKEIYLQNFRNYEETYLKLGEGVNIFLGENAQGKTNLLEAVSLLSGRRSFRAQRERDLIRYTKDRTGIMGKVSNEDDENILKLELTQDGKRNVTVNDVKKSKISDLSAFFHTVLFLPEDLRIIDAGSGVRRKYLDSAISQLSIRYSDTLRKYERVLDQKRKVLKEQENHPEYLSLLPDYNIQLGTYGSYLIQMRARYLNKLGTIAGNFNSEISGKRDQFILTYLTDSRINNALDDEKILQDILIQHLEERKNAEIASGMCLVGPHKDDFLITIGDQEARYFGSQGQIRTAAISLKLGERELQYETFGTYPVLLLDDVLSELDDQRRNFVVNQIKQGQVLLTCCRQEQLNSGMIFSVKNGIAEKMEELV